MVRRLIIGIVLAGTAGAAAAGCGGSDKPAKKEAGPEVAWAGRVCSAVGESGTRLKPPVSGHDTPQESQRTIASFLGRLSGELQGLEAALQQTGAPPVSGGQAVYTTALTNLAKTREQVDAAVVTLRKFRVKDEKSLERSLTYIGRQMESFAAYEGPTKDLRANPALNAAFRQAPECKDQIPQ